MLRLNDRWASTRWNLTSAWRTSRIWFCSCFSFFHRLLIDGRQNLGHLFQSLFFTFFPRLHFFSYTTFLVVDTVVLKTSSSGKRLSRCHCAAIPNLTSWRHYTFHPKLIKVTNIRTIYLCPHFEKVVASNSHRSLNNISFFVFPWLINNLYELLNDVVVTKDYVASFCYYLRIWMHDTSLAKVNVTL